MLVAADTNGHARHARNGVRSDADGTDGTNDATSNGKMRPNGSREFRIALILLHFQGMFDPYAPMGGLNATGGQKRSREVFTFDVIALTRNASLISSIAGWSFKPADKNARSCRCAVAVAHGKHRGMRDLVEASHDCLHVLLGIFLKLFAL